jgi:hypothetical protein
MNFEGLYLVSNDLLLKSSLLTIFLGFISNLWLLLLLDILGRAEKISIVPHLSTYSISVSGLSLFAN